MNEKKNKENKTNKPENGLPPEKKRRVIWALSLPGKVAPVTAGRYLAECVETLLKREESAGIGR